MRRTVLVAAAVAAAFFVGRDLPPMFGTDDSPAAEQQEIAAGAVTDETVPEPSGPTTTTFVLEGLGYRTGDCVWWDQSVEAGRTRDTDRVDCDRPHIMEMTGRVKLPLRMEYPTDTGWDALIDERCGPLARQYLGVIDPDGRFAASAIHPTAQGWDGADREVWCGIQMVNDRADWATAPDPEFVGRVKDQNQDRLYGTGACLRTGPETIDGAVPCDSAHHYEIAGTVDLTGAGVEPPSPEDQERLVGTRCDKVARAYLGRALPADAWAGWFDISPASWTAGRRTLECTLASYYPDGNARERTEPFVKTTAS